jgi:1-acyl-sn-glycerol-3-phosphate acyltransferase
MRQLPKNWLDAQGRSLALKRLLTLTLGWVTYPSFYLHNRLHISGQQHLAGLPAKGVLFVANHQTYFMDVIGIYHAIIRLLTPTRYLKWPTPLGHVYFIAAAETMAEGPLTRLLGYCGAIPIRRTWKEGERWINRPVNPRDIDRIGCALKDGWVFTFPQGTTKPGAAGRKGTAHLIELFAPVVVPVVIDGFDRAFHRTRPLVRREKGVDLSIRFKPPLAIEQDLPADLALRRIMKAIEQNEPAPADAPGVWTGLRTPHAVDAPDGQSPHVHRRRP